MTLRAIGLSGLKEYSKLPDDFRPNLLDIIFPPKEKPYYEKQKVLLGWYWKNRYNKEEGKVSRWFYTSDAPRSFICSKTGSGKTFMLKRFLSVYYKSNFNCFVADLHDEFSQCKYSLQEKHKKFLPDIEKPEGLPTLVLRPTFFSDKGENDTWFQLSYNDLTPQDFIEICGLESRYNEIILKHFNDAISLDGLISIIKTEEQAEPLIRALNNLKNYKVIGNEHNINVVDRMNKGYIIVANLIGYKQVPEKFYQIYIKIILSKLIEARIRKTHKIKGEQLEKELVVFIDEAHTIITKQENLASLEIAKQIRESRKFGVTFFFATQDLESVNPIVFEQSKYIIVSYNADLEELLYILKRRQRVIWHPAHKETWGNKLRMMRVLKSGWREWMLVLEKGGLINFFPYAPLVKHESGG